MNPASINNEQLLRISKIAVSRLARYTSMDEQKIEYSFLCDDDHFCGVRYRAGSFQAQWMFGQTCVEFTRENQFIDEIPLSDTGLPNRRAA